MTDARDPAPPPASAPPGGGGGLPAFSPPSPGLRGIDFFTAALVVVAVEWIGLERKEWLRIEPGSVRDIKATLVIRAAQLASVFLPLAIVRRVGPAAFGVHAGNWRRSLGWAAGVSAVLLAGFAAAALGAYAWSGANLVQAAFGKSPLAMEMTSRSRAVVLAAMVGVGPFAEEVVFRGILYQGLRRGFSAGETNLMTSLVFALVHPLQVPWIQFVGGVAFGLLYEKTGALLAPFLVHAGGNLAILVLPLVFA